MRQRAWRRRATATAPATVVVRVLSAASPAALAGYDQSFSFWRGGRDGGFSGAVGEEVERGGQTGNVVVLIGKQPL